VSIVVPPPELKFFSYSHLPSHLQEVSKVFHEAANWVLSNLPENGQRSVALQRLLEAKDAAVRALL